MFTREERQEATFGAFDGCVSVIGFVFALLATHASLHTIAIGGVGGAIAAAISMGIGDIEKGDESWIKRLPIGLTMFTACLVGSLVPVWPFFVFSRNAALFAAGIGCFVVATWIGFMKSKGAAGYIGAYVSLLLASGLTLAVVGLMGGTG